MSEDTKSVLTKVGKVLGIVAAAIALLTTFNGVYITQAGIATIAYTQAEHEKMETKRREVDAAIIKELRFLSGVIECDYRNIAYEQCPAIKAKHMSNNDDSLLF